MATDGSLDVLERGWRCGPVPPEVAAQADGRVFTEMLLPHIEKGCEVSNGRFTPEGCVERWISGRWIMWAVNSPENECVAVGFTQVNEYPDTGLRTFEVVLLGGSRMKAWRHLEPLLLENAKTNNCTRVEAYGRRGLHEQLPHWRRGYLIERDV